MPMTNLKEYMKCQCDSQQINIYASKVKVLFFFRPKHPTFMITESNLKLLLMQPLKHIHSVSINSPFL